MIFLRALRRRQRACKLKLRCRLAVDLDSRREEICVGQALGQLDIDLDHISRTNHLTELDVVDSRGDGNATGDRIAGLPRDQHRARLHRRFAQEYSRKHWLSGIMPAKYVE